MAATVTVRRWVGAGPTKTDITGATTMYVTADTHYGSGSSDPIPIPSSSTNRSYWQAHRLSADTTPVGTINNIKVYSDGASNLPTNVAFKGNTATAYTQATGTPGVTGNTLNTTNYPSLAAATADVFTWTSGSPKAVSGSITNPSTGDFGDFWVTQMEVPSTVTGTGETVGELLTVIYDET